MQNANMGEAPWDLVDLLRRRVNSAPDAAAVSDERGTWTARELGAYAASIRRLLISADIGRGNRVAFVGPKRKESIGAIIGILAAGGSYVPLDSASPPARNATMLARASCNLVLVLPGHTAELDLIRFAPGLQIVDLEELVVPPLATEPILPVLVDASAMDEAYVLFTSGSTGEPKGVSVSHGNVMSFTQWGGAYFGLDDDSVIGGYTPLTFDLSTFDLYATLWSGGRLDLVPAGSARFPATLIEFMRDRAITHWLSVPSVFAVLERSGALRDGDLPKMRELMWCGEVMPVPLFRTLQARLPHVRFTNMYGPTETTVASTFYSVGRIPEGATSVPIGRPCPGEKVLVLDDHGRVVGPDTLGELYIGGVGVARGYVADEPRTASVFVNLNDGKPARFYRTGDLGFRDAEGLLHLVGRADDQIKVRGHRVELGEVQAALASDADLPDAAVVARLRVEGDQTELWCVVVTADQHAASQAIRASLVNRLPGYMIPTRWCAVERLPITPHGKVDRAELERIIDARQAPVATGP